MYEIMKIHIVTTLLILLMFPSMGKSLTMRTVTSRDGLSSMFVMSLYQDSLGYMWVGTYNGVSILEGNNSKAMDMHGRLFTALNGHVVEGIQGGALGQLWFHSNFGLTAWQAGEQELRRYPEINGMYKFAVSSHNEVVAVSQERGLLFYNAQTRQFVPFSFENLRYADILAMSIDRERVWHVVTQTTLYEILLTTDGNGNIRPQLKKRTEHPSGTILIAHIDGDQCFYVDQTNELYQVALRGGKTKHLFSVTQLLQRRGDISTIVRYGQEVVIGFVTNGAVRMCPSKGDGTILWEERTLDVHSGVFDIKYDSRQDILWVATDGEGIRYFFKAPYEMRTETFGDLPFEVSSPVRAIQCDRNGDLWVATKGDGLVCYKDYHPEDGSRSGIVNYTVENSALLHNSVYCMTEGQNGVIWMGTDGRGVNYYLPDRHKMGVLVLDELPVYNVHGIAVTDGRLWVATWGHGVYCIELAWAGDVPQAKAVHQLLYDPAHWELSQFLAAQADGHDMWLASRENGVTRVDGSSLKTKTIHFDHDQRLSARNDVVSVNTLALDGILCATSAGLVLQPRTPGASAQNLTETWGLEPTPVRSIIYTRTRDVWFSSPRMLTLYKAKSRTCENYAIGNEIEVSEFVESAAYYDAERDVKYFGGTNGFVVVSPQRDEIAESYPEILFHDILFLTGGLYIHPLIGDKPVELTYNQNAFTVKYDAVDYTHAGDYIFEYRLKGASDMWLQNGNAHSVSFSHLRPGNYTLQVRYHKDEYVSPAYELAFRIRPPWWFSWPMKVLYWLLTLALIAYVAYRYVRRQRRRQQYVIERMNERHREEVYESKLRFFTNLTHEFSTPLTLIGGPCQRILAMTGLPSQVKEYVSIIRHNSVRLNDLIQQIIEYRRIDTGNREMHVIEADIASRFADIVNSFAVEAEKSDIDYKAKAQPNLLWPTDLNAFSTIAINLISNAFKYVPDHGTIRVTLRTTEDDKLQLTISNSGHGISQAEIDRMFNRYTILEDLENNSRKRGFARNGLGLAITQGLVKALGGDIDVKGENNLTTFTVTLPRQELSGEAPLQAMDYTVAHYEEDAPPTLEHSSIKLDETRPTVVVVDDDEDMLWFLNDILRKEYNVLSFTGPKEAFGCIMQTNVALVLSDIIMEPFDGVELCRRIKRQNGTSHIPVILLSSAQSEETRRATADAGAEVFLTKPFDLEYFTSVVRNQLKRNIMLKDYFNSSLSAFEVVDGQHIHQEDKEMLDRLTKIINDNLTNPDLSTQFIAKEMGIGLRNIYRKLQGVTSLTPKDMIHEARLERARQLLAQTGKSMEEVCYKAGFNNRGTFYKLFAAKFGCTPKQYHERLIEEAREKLKGES